MKKIVIIVAAICISSTSMFAQSKAGKQDLTKHTVLQSCPKHHSLVVYNPSKCPLCGMDLNLSQKEQVKLQITKAYSCPTNANVVTISQSGKLNLSPKEEMKTQVVKLHSSPAQGCGMGMAMSN